MKKLLSILASVLMVLAIVTPVSADDTVSNVSSREELETALKDPAITRIELTDDIDLSDAEWIGVVVDSGRKLVINGNNHTITGLKSYKAAKGPNGSGIAGDGGSCDYYNGWIAWNEGTLTINDLNFEGAYVDTNPLTTASNSTGSSILAVVVANNAGELIYNNVNVNSSEVRGYTKVGILLGFTQDDGTTTINNSSVTNSKVVLEADGTDPEACFAGIIAGYDGGNKVSTYGVMLKNNTGEIDDSVVWEGHTKGVSESGVEYYVHNGAKYGMFSSTYSKGGEGIYNTAYVVSIDGYGYESLYDAVVYAKNNDKIVLLDDITENIIIPEGANVTIDLNGHSITNVSDHTILNKGTVTIEGEGTIDNVSHERAAVYNELGASALLKGGTYTRSQENGSNSSTSGGNSYYNIVNHGDMTIEEGVAVHQDGKFSSLIENGWYNGNENTEKKPSNMVIHGGTFTGGLNTIKNDDYGKLTINGGTFTNVAQAAVLNWNETTINNGTFVSDQAVILNGKLNDVMDKGKLIINDGTFTAGGDHEVIEKMSGGHEDSLTDIRISGGTFSGDVSAYVEAGNKIVETEDGFIVAPNTEGVKLDASKKTLKVGESTTLHATLTPEGAVEELVWTSSDPTIVTVDANGTITAVKEGSATITVTAGAYRAQCEVTVVAAEDETQEPTTPPTDDKDPGTSTGEKEPGIDNEGPATSAVAMGGMFASMAVLSGGIVVVLREKRRRNS